VGVRRWRAVGLAAALVAAGCASGSAPREALEGIARDRAETTVRVTDPAPTTTEPPATVTLAFTGDLLPHAPVSRQAAAYGVATGVPYDYGPMFARVAPVLAAADVAICHLETPLSPDDTNLSTYPVYNVPREIAVAVAGAGWDGCTVASNHAIDAWDTGVAATLDVLDAAGLRHAGTARSAEEAATPTIYEVGEVTVASLDYTYGLNGFSLPDDKPWLVNLIDPDRILADAAAAREAGADVVVVGMHWGEQYVTEPTADQQALARRLLASPDVDLIVGAHAHVVQPVERIDGEYVVYGLGNFLSNQSPECCAPGAQDGVIVTAEVQVPAEGPVSVTGLVVTPTWVDRSDYTVLPVAAALDDPATPEWMRPDLEASWERTLSTLTSLGAPGLLASDYPGPG
jgi:poly-gamma-glutamate capsule biosynthesis protein CapA/YwtB (metallophosphatase superfamily)